MTEPSPPSSSGQDKLPPPGPPSSATATLQPSLPLDEPAAPATPFETANDAALDHQRTIERTTSSTSTPRLFPIRSVVYPSSKARQSGSHELNALQSPVSGSQPSGGAPSVDNLASPSKPRSLDPFLEEPTSHPKFQADDDVTTHRVGDASSTAGSLRSERQYAFTSRFEHETTADGEHLVITGREGKITRCEDEVRASVLPRNRQRG